VLLSGSRRAKSNTPRRAQVQNITVLRMPDDPTRLRGYGFVHFVEMSGARRALADAESGRVFQCGEKQLTVNVARPQVRGGVGRAHARVRAFVRACVHACGQRGGHSCGVANALRAAHGGLGHGEEQRAAAGGRGCGCAWARAGGGAAPFPKALPALLARCMPCNLRTGRCAQGSTTPRTQNTRGWPLCAPHWRAQAPKGDYQAGGWNNGGSYNDGNRSSYDR